MDPDDDLTVGVHLQVTKLENNLMWQFTSPSSSKIEVIHKAHSALSANRALYSTIDTIAKLTSETLDSQLSKVLTRLGGLSMGIASSWIAPQK